MKVVAIFCVFFLQLPAQSQAFLSPLRLPGESFEHASHRQLLKSSSRVWQKDSVYEARNELHQLDPRTLSRWDSKTPIEVAFRQIRDRRTLEDPLRPKFPRRVSWLFPDDGCYVRAEVAALWLQEQGFPKPAKIFIFGSLRAATPHHPAGEVKWWYHVVVGYQTTTGVVVFDPAVEPTAPLSLKAWSEAVSEDDVTFSFCDRNSIDPDSICQGAPAENPQNTIAEEDQFLTYEWDRQIELGRDPSRVLGEEPPWLEAALIWPRASRAKLFR